MINETATPEKKALLEAFDTVLKTQAEEREAQLRLAEARRLARARSRPVMWLSTAIILVVGTYLSIARPEWAVPPQLPPESAEVREASVRIGMANAAQHVERYRQQHGRLPHTLAEAGAHGHGFHYELVADSSGWRLSAPAGAMRLTLGSTEPLNRFVGNSFEVISRRNR